MESANADRVRADARIRGTTVFEERRQHYRSPATRLRVMAERTRFAELRSGYLELAARFERLAERSEHKHTFDMPGAVRVDARHLAKPES